MAVYRGPRPFYVERVRRNSHAPPGASPDLKGPKLTILQRKLDGSGKAAVETAKASLGPIAGGAVQLAAIQPDCGKLIAEGIETALPVGQSCGLPAWAALSAGEIRNLVLPAEARMVLICADNDLNGTGQRASQCAAARFLAEGRRVRLALPPMLGVDFNDRLRGSASAHVDENSHVA